MRTKSILLTHELLLRLNNRRRIYVSDSSSVFIQKRYVHNKVAVQPMPTSPNASSFSRSSEYSEVINEIQDILNTIDFQSVIAEINENITIDELVDSLNLSPEIMEEVNKECLNETVTSSTPVSVNKIAEVVEIDTHILEERGTTNLAQVDSCQTELNTHANVTKEDIIETLNTKAQEIKQAQDILQDQADILKVAEAPVTAWNTLLSYLPSIPWWGWVFGAGFAFFALRGMGSSFASTSTNNISLPSFNIPDSSQALAAAAQSMAEVSKTSIEAVAQIAQQNAHIATTEVSKAALNNAQSFAQEFTAKDVSEGLQEISNSLMPKAEALIYGISDFAKVHPAVTAGVGFLGGLGLCFLHPKIAIKIAGGVTSFFSAPFLKK